jgi:hypothetical protein
MAAMLDITNYTLSMSRGHWQWQSQENWPMIYRIATLIIKVHSYKGIYFIGV